MSKTSLLTIILISCLIVSCKRKADFSDPKSVVEEYYSLTVQGKHKSAFNLVADTCKEYVTLDEFIEYFSPADFLSNQYEYNFKNISQLPVDPLYPQYGKFEVTLERVAKINNDTMIYYAYPTVYNEKGKWKLIWTNNIYEEATKLMDSRRYLEAIQAYEKVLRYDPLDGNVYRKYGIYYFAQNNFNEALINGNKALDLSPNLLPNYELLLLSYSITNYHNIAKLLRETVFELNYTNKQKRDFFYTISKLYLAIWKSEEALESVDLALLIDSTYTPAWWFKGDIYHNKQNLDSALICYQKATQLKPMENESQKKLYFDLADTEYMKANLNTTSFDEKRDLLFSAKEHIQKALSIDPFDIEFKILLDKINKAKKQE